MKKTKSQSNFRLTPKTKKALKIISEMFNMSEAEVVEDAIWKFWDFKMGMFVNHAVHKFDEDEIIEAWGNGYIKQEIYEAYLAKQK